METEHDQQDAFTPPQSATDAYDARESGPGLEADFSNHRPCSHWRS